MKDFTQFVCRIVMMIYGFSNMIQLHLYQCKLTPCEQLSLAKAVCYFILENPK